MRNARCASGVRNGHFRRHGSGFRALALRQASVAWRVLGTRRRVNGDERENGGWRRGARDDAEVAFG
jgi:hypothetical protein